MAQKPNSSPPVSSCCAAASHDQLDLGGHRRDGQSPDGHSHGVQSPEGQSCAGHSREGHSHEVHSHDGCSHDGHSHGDHAHAPSATSSPRRPDAAELAGTTRQRYFIAGMDCPTEEALLRRHLQREGVVALDFDLINRLLDVHHRLPDDAPLRAAIAAAGMTAEPIGAATPAPAPPPAVPRGLRWRMALAGVAAMAAEGLAFAGWDEAGPPVIALALTAIALGGLPTLRKGWIALRSLTLNIHLLMTLAVTGAIVLGQWPEAAMVVWLFGLSEMMESLSLARARDAIRALTQLAPETATQRLPDGRWQTVAADAVPLGARVRVPPGERVPLDGRVVSGRSSLNEAALTGEAMPVDKAPGDALLAGSINGDGLLEMDVTAAKGDTLLDRMAAAVQQAQSQRAPTQAFIDRFARWYTPVVVLGALLLAVVPPLLGLGPWSDWIYKGLVVLVIACPCALVISTPVTIVSGLARAARLGILVKGGLYLERARQLRVLAVDKTGTLTQGRPQLAAIDVLAPGLTQDEALHLAARLDAGSTHPLARAIVAAHAERVAQFVPGEGGAAQTAGLPAPDKDRDGVVQRASCGEGTPCGQGASCEQGSSCKQGASHGEAAPRGLIGADHVQNLPGLGVTAEIDGQHFALGNERLARERGAVDAASTQAAAALQAQGHTLVWLLQDQRVLALLALSDTPRPEAAPVLAALRRRGLTLVMLSGDQHAPAVAMARRLGLDETEVRAPLLPQDKLDAVAALAPQGPVGMLGDGVNDAPALARADIAIAMGAAGSATALETADIALMQDDLRKLPQLLALSDRVATILKQNIAVALGLKAVVGAMTLVGIGSLWLAVLADAGASLLVVLNGLRLLRQRPDAMTSGT